MDNENIVTNDKENDVIETIPAENDIKQTAPDEELVEFKDYFNDILKNNSQPPSHSPQLSTVNSQLSSVSNSQPPQTLSQQQLSTGSNSQLSILKSYGLNNYKELEAIRDENPEIYHQALSDLNFEKMMTRNQSYLENYKQEVYTQNILFNAKSQGVNPQDFQNYCNYYGMPITERALDNFKLQLARKVPKNSANYNLDTLNKVAEIQQNQNPNITSSKTPKIDTSAEETQRVKDIINNL